jgi:hypothetical protein
MSNPFRRPGHPCPIFDCYELRDIAILNPLSAKQLLEQAIAEGHITFPHGLTDQRFYTNFWDYPDSPDIEACKARYGQLVSGDTTPSAFPLAFVLELFDRIAAGEHPQFVHWAQATIEQLLCGARWNPSELVQYTTHIPQ